MDCPPRIALAIGDPNGIGPEIVLRAAVESRREEAARPIVIGDRAVVDHYVAQAQLSLEDIEVRDVASLPRAAFVPGEIRAEAGAACIAYAREAIAMASAGRADAVLAGPHNERAVHAAGIAFNGYPGLLAEATATAPENVFLRLIGGGLLVTHVTLHQSLRSAIEDLSPARVEAAIAATDAVCRRLGRSAPSIGVAGLNPHAGEAGLFGDEDEAVIAPAVAAARAAGIDAHGPVGADLVFSERRHDACVAMFHDQGHIAVKVAAGRRTLALSIGTPVLFASVGHGSAHDIAGLGTADARPMIDALTLMTELIGQTSR